MKTYIGKNSKEEMLRKEIFNCIKKIYKIRPDNKFIAGKTRINYAGRIYNENEIISLVDSSLDFWLTAGRFSAKFEKDLANFLGTKYCLLTNSGSSANLLAISALTSEKLQDRQLKTGDEVITTAAGFPTTLNPIIQNNLVPVFVDIKHGTHNIDTDKIEKAISNKTKAIVVAHTLGNMAKIDEIIKIAKKHNLWVVEDNCDALGSKYKGKYSGTFGDISTCSFFPAHHITTGEGGAVFTNNPLLRNIIASFRDWGKDCWCPNGSDNTCKKRFSLHFSGLPKGYDHKYIYSHIGYNLKMTDMQAAIGIAQLKKLSVFIKKRQKNFIKIYEFLKKFQHFLDLPEIEKETQPSWFGFPIVVKENAPFKRNDLVQWLEDNNIATRMLFGGNLTKQPAYKNIKFRISGNLSNTDRAMNQLFWIGVYPGIQKKELHYIKKTFDLFFTKF